MPQYEVFTPRIFRESVRTKREEVHDLLHPLTFTFGLSAFDRDFHLNLSLNKNLLGPNLNIEIKSKNGTTKKKRSKQCHYFGKVHGAEHSIAAVSACKGMVSNHVF